VPLKPPGFPPQTQADWDRWARATAVKPDTDSVTTVTVADKAITDAKLRDSQPTSVIGRVTNTLGTPTDIAAAVDDAFLVRRAGTLTFGFIAETDIPSELARDAEVTAAIGALSTVYVPQLSVLNASKTYDPPSLADAAGTTTTVTCTGAALGDFALASFSLDLQGITVTAYVSATDTVAARFQNESGGTVDLGSGTLRVRVWKQ
jgi:hypothetical protein